MPDFPQMIVPATFDQADNGYRVERLGAGVTIPARKFNGARGAAALEQLMQPQHRAACAAIKARLEGSDAMPETVGWIERTFAGR